MRTLSINAVKVRTVISVWCFTQMQTNACHHAQQGVVSPYCACVSVFLLWPSRVRCAAPEQHGRALDGIGSTVRNRRAAK